MAVGMKMAGEIVIEVGSKTSKRRDQKRFLATCSEASRSRYIAKDRPVGGRQIVQLQKSIAERTTELSEYLLPISDRAGQASLGQDRRRKDH